MGRIIISIITILLISNLSQSQNYNNKMVFAHYLPWFDADGSYPNSWERRGWCYEGDCSDLTNIHYSNSPRIGEYSLSDSDVIDYHILTAFMAGIDGFIINVNPSYGYQKNITTDVLDRINSLKSNYTALTNFKVIISYDNSSADSITITNNFMAVYNDFYNNATYESLFFRDETNNNQVLITWSESDAETYYSTVNSIWGSDEVSLLIRNSINFDHSDGNFQWVNGFSSPTNEDTNWGESYFNDFEWIMARQSTFGLTNPANENTVMMGMAYPGFDDVNVPSFWNGGNHRLIKRHVTAGETMSLTWDRQINYTPNALGGTNVVENPWIQLITWNDWPEGTSIEPATDDTYGFTPLLTNKMKVDGWKGNNGFGSECIEIPYMIYEAKKIGLITEANSAMALLMAGNCTAAADLLNPTLPVELIDFDVNCTANEIQLIWKTASEENSSHFEIEQSEDGINWITIGAVNAKNEASNYDFNINKNAFYRLKIIDLDNSYQYSEIIQSKCLFKGFSISYYPNPVSDNLNIGVNSDENKFIEISIINSLGKTIFENHFEVEKGVNNIEINMSDFNKGIYYLSMEREGGVLQVGTIVKE